MSKRCVVITNPMIAANRSAEVTLSKFLRVISTHYDKIDVVGGNVTVEPDLKDIQLHSVEMTRGHHKLRRVMDHISLQFRLNRMVKPLIEPNVAVYFWVADKMLLPYLTAQRRKGDLRYFVYGNVMKEGSAGLFTRFSGKLIAYMASHANSVCVESPGVLKEWEGVFTPRKLRTIHLYTDEIAEKVTRTPDAVIGMLCRLTEGKRVPECIRAFARFHKDYPDYSLEIIGSGRLEAVCREQISQCEADSFVHMAGWVEHSEVTNRAARWEYLLFPSDTEGMPNSVLEMMGQGIPVIASPVGGVGDLIVSGENGWLLDGTTEEDIYNALCAAVFGKEGYAVMAEKALATIRSRYTLREARVNAGYELV